MVPFQGESIEKEEAEHDEHHKGYNLLNDLELHEGEWAAVSLETDSVGGHLTAIFEKRYAPGNENNHIQRPVCRDSGGRQFKMAIPCKSHEDIAHHEQYERQ